MTDGQIEQRRVSVTIATTTPAAGSTASSSVQSTTTKKQVSLSLDDIEKSIREIVEKIAAEYYLTPDQKQNLLDQLLSHLKDGSSFKIDENGGKFATDEELYIHLAYAGLLNSLNISGVNVDTAAKSDPELRKSLASAIRTYKQFKNAEGIILANDLSVSLDFLAVLGKEYQAAKTGTKANIVASWQAQVIAPTERKFERSELKDIAAKALINLSLLDADIDVVVSMVERHLKDGYTLPRNFADATNGANDYRAAYFYGSLLASAGYDIGLDAPNDAQLIINIRRTIERFKRDYPQFFMNNPSNADLTSIAVNYLLSAPSSEELRRLVSAYVVDDPRKSRRYLDQLAAVERGNTKLFVVYDSKGNELKVFEYNPAQGSLREISLSENGAAQILLSASGWVDGGINQTAVSQLARFNAGDKTGDFSAASQIAAFIENGKLDDRAFSDARALLSSGAWPETKALVKSMSKGGKEEDLLLMDLNSAELMISALYLLGYESETSEDLSKRLDKGIRAATILEKSPHVVELFKRMREVHNEFGIAYPVKVSGKKIKETGTANVFLFLLFSGYQDLAKLPSDVRAYLATGPKDNKFSIMSDIASSDRSVVVIDSGTLKAFLQRKAVEVKMDRDPAAVISEATQNPENYRNIGLPPAAVKWQAKILSVKREGKLSQEEFLRLMREIDAEDESDLSCEQKKGIKQALIQALAESFDKEITASVEKDFNGVSFDRVSYYERRDYTGSSARVFLSDKIAQLSAAPLNASDKKDVLFALYARIIAYTVGFESAKEAIEYLEQNKDYISGQISKEKYNQLVAEVKKRKSSDEINDFLTQGKVAEAIAYVKSNSDIFFSGIEDKKQQKKALELKNQVNDAIEKANFQAARRILWQAFHDEESIKIEAYSKMMGYVDLLENLYKIRFTVTVSNLPTDWSVADADRNRQIQPGAVVLNEYYLKANRLDPNKKEYAAAIEELKRSQIIEIQQLLSGIPVQEGASQTFLSSNFTFGVMDQATIIALAMFTNRFMPDQTIIHTTEGMLKDCEKTKTLALVVDETTFKKLREEYSKYTRTIALNQALANTKLGMKVIALGDGGKLSDVTKGDFIWVMAQYLIDRYRGVVGSQELLVATRVRDAIFGQGTLSALDIYQFAVLCDKSQIDEDKLRALFSSAPPKPVSEFPVVSVNFASKTLSYDVRDGVQTVRMARGDVYTYAPADAVLRQPIAYWKSIYVNQMGGRLASETRGSAVYSPCFTGEDFGYIADFLSQKNVTPTIHYPINQDYKLVEELQKLYATLPDNSEEKILIARILSSDLLFLIDQDLASSSIDPKIRDILGRDILGRIKLDTPRHKLESQINELANSTRGNVPADVASYFRSLWKRAVSNRVITITPDEHKILLSLQPRCSGLSIVVRTIRPDNPMIASPSEIKNLRELAARYQNQGVYFDDLEKLANEGNAGARWLLLAIKGGRQGIMDTEEDNVLNIAPVVVDMGLSAKPQTSKMLVLKREFTSIPGGLKERAADLRKQKEDIDKQITAYQYKKDITASDRTALATLRSSKAVIQAELDSITAFMDGDSVTSEFLVWLDGRMAGKGTTADYLTRFAAEYLSQLYYVDVVTGERRNLNDAVAVLRTADARLRAILPQYAQRGLYSLDLNSEGIDLTEEQRNELLQIKQALCALINMAVDGQAISSMPGARTVGRQVLAMAVGEKASSYVMHNLFGGAGVSEVQQLKSLVVENYRYILKERMPQAYLDYVLLGDFEQDTFSEIDIEILIQLFGIIGETELKEDLQKLLDNKRTGDKSLWIEDAVDPDKFEVKFVARKIIKKLRETKRINVGTVGADTEVDRDGLLETLLPPFSPGYVDTAGLSLEDVSSLKKALKEEGIDLGLDDLEALAMLPVEASLHFIAEQVILRSLMPLYIRFGLPAEMVGALLDGKYWKLGKNFLALNLWGRVAPLWYKQAFKELEQQHYATFLVMLWSINYIAFKGGWASVWGRTATLDAEAVKFARYIPGIELVASTHPYKGALKYLSDWVTATDPYLRASETVRSNAWLRRPGKFAWGLTSPFSLLEHEVMELKPDEVAAWVKERTRFAQSFFEAMSLQPDKMATWVKSGTKFTQSFFEGANFTFDLGFNLTSYPFNKIGLALDRSVEDGWLREDVSALRSMTGTGRLQFLNPDSAGFVSPFGRGQNGDLEFARDYLRKGGNLTFDPGQDIAARADIRVNPDGSFEPSGMGSLEDNIALSDLIRNRRAEGSPLAGLYTGNNNRPTISVTLDKPVPIPEAEREQGPNAPQYRYEQQSFNLRVSEIAVVSGSETRIEVLSSELLSQDRWSIRLIISGDELGNQEALRTSLGRLNGTHILPSSGMQERSLNGLRFGDSPQGLASRTTLAGLEDPSKNVRRMGTGETALSDRTTLNSQDQDFWIRFRSSARGFSQTEHHSEADRLEFRAWLLAATRRAYADYDAEARAHGDKPKGDRVLSIEQIEALALFDVGDGGRYENTLLQLGCGQGKTLPTLLAPLQAALQGETVYIQTTSTDLVRQMAADSQEPAIRVLRELEREGLIKIWVDDGSIKNPYERAERYKMSQVVIQTHSQHVFDLESVQTRGSIRPGILFIDEIDKPAVEDASEAHIISAPKGAFDNPIISWSNSRAYKRGWKEAYKEFKKLMGAGEVGVSNPYIGYDTRGGMVLTEDGIKEICKDLELTEIDDFTLHQFNQFFTATELKNEEDPKYVERKRADKKKILSEEYKYQFKDGEITLIDQSNSPAPGRFFGGGLDVALRLVHGAKLSQENITLSEMTFGQAWRYHNAVFGLSGTLRENYEFLTELYPDMRFRMIDMPNSVPEIVITSNDLEGDNPARDAFRRLEAAVRTREGFEFAPPREIDGRPIRITAKIILEGIEPNDPRLQSFHDSLNDIVDQNGNINVSVVEKNPRIVVSNNEQAFEQAAGLAISTAEQGRPVLLCVEDIPSVEALRSQLLIVNPDASIDVYTADITDPKEVEQILERSKSQGHILIATRASRGTNITSDKKSVTSANLDEIDPGLGTGNLSGNVQHVFRGGMFVISINPPNVAAESQQHARGPRADLPGTSITFVTADSSLIRDNLSEADIARLTSDLRSGNMDSARSFVEQAYITAYQKMFSQHTGRIDISEVKGEFSERNLHLGTLLSAGRDFRTVNVDLSPEVARLSPNFRGIPFFAEISIRTVDRAFLGIEVGEEGLTSRQARVLEKRFARLLGNRTVDLRGLVGCSEEQAKDILIGKFGELFSASSATRRLIADESALSPFLTERAKIQQMIDKRWSEYNEASERVSQSRVYNDNPAHLEARIRQLGERFEDNVASDIFKWAFPRTGPGRGIETSYSFSRLGLVVTSADVLNAPVRMSPLLDVSEVPQTMPEPPEIRPESPVVTPIERGSERPVAEAEHGIPEETRAMPEPLAVEPRTEPSPIILPDASRGQEPATGAESSSSIVLSGATNGTRPAEASETPRILEGHGGTITSEEGRSRSPEPAVDVFDPREFSDVSVDNRRAFSNVSASRQRDFYNKLQRMEISVGVIQGDGIDFSSNKADRQAFEAFLVDTGLEAELTRMEQRPHVLIFRLEVDGNERRIIVEGRGLSARRYVSTTAAAPVASPEAEAKRIERVTRQAGNLSHRFNIKGEEGQAFHRATPESHQAFYEKLSNLGVTSFTIVDSEGTRIDFGGEDKAALDAFLSDRVIGQNILPKDLRFRLEVDGNGRRIVVEGSGLNLRSYRVSGSASFLGTGAVISRKRFVYPSGTPDETTPRDITAEVVTLAAQSPTSTGAPDPSAALLTQLEARPDIMPVEPAVPVEASPSVIVLDSNSIKTEADLLKAIEAVSSDSAIIRYETASGIRISADRADLSLWLESSDPSAFGRILKGTVSANNGMPSEYIRGFLHARREEIKERFSAIVATDGECSVFVPNQTLVGTKQELISQVTTMVYGYESPDGKKISIRLNKQDIRDLTSAEQAVSDKAKSRIEDSVRAVCTELGIADNVQKIIESVLGHLYQLRIPQLVGVVLAPRLLRLQGEIYQEELAKARRQLRRVSAEDGARIMEEVNLNVARAVGEYEALFSERLEGFVRETGRTNLTKSDIERIWKSIEDEQRINRQSGTFGKGRKVIGRTFGGAATGLAMGLILEGASELISGDFNGERFVHKTLDSAVSWGKFELTSAILADVIGLSPMEAMIGAMALPAVWDVADASYNDKGRILISHGASTTGLLLAHYGTNLFLKKTALGSEIASLHPGVARWGGLAVGIGAAWAFGKMSEYAYENVDAYRSFNDSREMKAIAEGFGSVDTLLTYALGPSAVLRFAGFGSAKTILSAKSKLLWAAFLVGSFNAFASYANGEYNNSVNQRIMVRLRGTIRKEELPEEIQENTALLRDYFEDPEEDELVVRRLRPEDRIFTRDQILRQIPGVKSQIDVFFEPASISIGEESEDPKATIAFRGNFEELLLKSKGLTNETRGQLLHLWRTTRYLTELAQHDGRIKTKEAREIFISLLDQAVYGQSIYTGSDDDPIYGGVLYRGQVLSHNSGLVTSDAALYRLQDEIIGSDVRLSNDIRNGLAEMFIQHAYGPDIGKYISMYLDPISWGKISVPRISETVRRAHGEEMFREAHTVYVEISEKTVCDYAMSYAREKGVSFDSKVVIGEVVRHFGIKIPQYLAIIPKMEAMMVQSQIASIYMLDPSGYQGTLVPQRSDDDLNADIRRMFNPDGTIIQGQKGSFVTWVRNNEFTRERFLTQRSSRLVSEYFEVCRMFEVMELEKSGKLGVIEKSDMLSAFGKKQGEIIWAALVKNNFIIDNNGVGTIQQNIPAARNNFSLAKAVSYEVETQIFGLLQQLVPQRDQESLIVFDGTEKKWVVNKDSVYYENFEEAKRKNQGQAADERLVFLEFVTEQDKRLGFVDPSGYLNLQSRRINTALGGYFKDIETQASKTRARADGLNKKIAQLEARAKKLEDAYLVCRQQAYALFDFERGGIIPGKEKEFEALAKKAEEIAGKIKPILVEISQRMAEIRSLKYKIMLLQQQLHDEKDPMKRAMLEAEIKGLGGKIEVNDAYYKQVAHLIDQNKKIDPKKDLEAFARFIKAFDSFVV